MIRFITKTLMARMPRQSSFGSVRFLSQSNRMFDKVIATPNLTQSPTSSMKTQENPDPALKRAWDSHSMTVSNFDKRILVSVGKYKSIQDVPKEVSHETIEHARDRFRIKVCIYMMVVGTIICFIQAVRGKRAHQRGESEINKNMEWHRKYNETAKSPVPKTNITSD